MLAFVPITVKNAFFKLFFRYTADAKTLRSYKDKHKDESCFIIGNGPSLTIADLEKISDRFTFCSNMIYKIFDITSFRPTYYVVGDVNFFPKYFKETLRFGISDYFVTRAAKKKMPFPSNVHCFNTYGPFCLVKESMKNNDFSEDASAYLAVTYTVTFLAIQLAAYMGFKTIYLVGVDHKYAVTANDKGEIVVDNTVASSHAKGLEEEATSSLQAVDSTTYSYQIARQYCDKHGIEIRNATRGGALNVFERIDFDEAVRLSKERLENA
jgi:hypothetical protein